MAKTVSIQAVGIYLGTQYDSAGNPLGPYSVTLEDDNATLGDALSFIQGSPELFPNLTSLTVTPESNGLQALSAVYTSDFYTRSNKQLSAGKYNIFETPLPLFNATNVWQYYISDANGTRKPVSGETPYFDYNFADGDTAIFRNVIIRIGSSGTSAKGHTY